MSTLADKEREFWQSLSGLGREAPTIEHKRTALYIATGLSNKHSTIELERIWLQARTRSSETNIPTLWILLAGFYGYPVDNMNDAKDFIMGTPEQIAILKDTFSTSLDPGAVNNTTAEPTGQTRSVTDTENKISIGGGKFGSCVRLNGTTDAYSAVDGADFQPTGNFSISAWFKTSITAYRNIFQSYSKNTYHAGIYINLNSSGRIEYLSGKNSGTVSGTDYKVANGNILLTDGQWHHVVCTWDGSKMHIYTDGIEDGTGTTWTDAPVYAATNYVRFGCTCNTGTNAAFFTGLFDDLSFWNGKALSLAEVQTLYANELNTQTALLADASLKAYYRFESGNLTTDTTANGHTLTAIGTPTLISGSQLLISGGKASAAHGDPVLYYSGITKVAGRMLMARINPAATGTNLYFGFDDNGSGLPRDVHMNFTTTLTAYYNGNALTQSIGTYTAGTTYDVAIIIRSTGTYFFIKGGTFTYWTLLWADNTYSLPATLYPGLESYNGTMAVDNMRIPSTLWLPSPIASDSFNRSNGALGSTDGAGHAESSGIGSGGAGLAWTGSTWTISSNTAINTPVTFGGDVIVDGGLEDWASATDLTNWTETVAGTTTVNRDSVEQHSGSYCVRIDVDASESVGSVAQTLSTSGALRYRWYKLSVWMKASAAGKKGQIGIGTIISQTLNPGTTWTQYSLIARSDSTSTVFSFKRSTSSASSSVYFDDVTATPLTLSELFSSIGTSTKDYLADVALVVPSDGMAGLVTNLDSASNPQSFIIAYVDRTSLGSVAKLVKCVNGVYTEVVSASITYSASAVLRVVKQDTSFTLYYNNAIVGATSTISDTEIVNNTLHGMFSTLPTCTLDNFIIRPRGTNNEYSLLDKL